MQKKILFVIGLVTFSLSYSQTFVKVPYQTFLKDYSKLMSEQPSSWYEANVESSVFMDIKSEKATEISTSYLKVFESGNYYFESGQSSQIQFKNLRLDIDTVERQVMLSKAVPEALLGFNAEQFNLIDSNKYEFFRANKENKTFLKVKEKKPMSSMETLVFEFNSKNELKSLEMYYWPANYSSDGFDDNSIEHPVVKQQFAIKHNAKDGDLENIFVKWVSHDLKTNTYDCPNKNYMFYDLLNKK